MHSTFLKKNCLLFNDDVYCVLYHYKTENTSLLCDKSVTTQNLAFLSNWHRKKLLQIHF